jgi:hypothetical protein
MRLIAAVINANDKFLLRITDSSLHLERRFYVLDEREDHPPGSGAASLTNAARGAPAINIDFAAEGI